MLDNRLFKRASYAGSLPEKFQPGSFVTMQPVDAPNTHEYCINNDSFIGQPKIDGTRLVVIADDDIYYQERSLNVVAAPSLEIHEGLQAAREHFGIFVLLEL